MNLRPYQQEMLDAIAREMARGNNRLLLKAPTGTGKTVTFAAMLKDPALLAWLEQFPVTERKMLIVAHREELLDQAAEKISRSNRGVMVSIEQGARTSNRWSDVVIASIQTLAAAQFRRLEMLMRHHRFRIVVVDEAHHAAAPSYRTALVHLGFLPPEDASDEVNAESATEKDAAKLAAHLAEWDTVVPKDRLLVGFTATPNRTDAIGLGCVFQTIAYSYELRKAITDGWLVPITPWVVDTSVSLDGVRTARGDFNQKDLADAVNNPHRNGLAVDAWHKHAHERPTLAFTVDVQHAHDLAAMFRERGIRAQAVSGETPKDERRAMLNDFKAGRLDVLTNCMVLTEGTDLPRASCILHAKPTKSATLYEQMCLDSETEILTERGWRGIDDVGYGRVAAFDMTDGSIHWSGHTRIERERGGEQMWGIASPHLNIRVTGGHKMVIRTRHAEAWRLQSAETLPAEMRIPLAGFQDVPDAPITDADIAFLGLLLTDGNYSRANKAVSLFQSESYPQVIEMVRQTLVSCGMKFTESVNTRPSNFGARSPLHRWTVSFGAPRGRDKHLRGWGYLHEWVSETAKNLTPAYEGLSARQVRVLMNALHAGDGVKPKQSDWEIATWSICANHELADQLQSLFVRRGMRCNKSNRTDNLAMLHVSPDRREWSITRTAKDGRPNWGVVSWESTERIWCVTVDTGAIVTRRNGFVSVVGNTGRGLRLFDGKADCVVIDVVDIARKHSLQTAPVLYGLPPGLISEKGKNLAEMAEEWERFAEAHPGVNVEKLGRVAIEQLKVTASTFNVWDIPVLGAFAAGRTMNWVKTAADRFRLQYPWQGGTETIEVAADLLGKFEVVSTFRPGAGPVRQRTLVTGLESSAVAAKFAETFVDAERGEVRILVKNGASWRREPATARQLAAMRYRRIAHPANCTKGQAADLLNIARARAGQ